MDDDNSEIEVGHIRKFKFRGIDVLLKEGLLYPSGTDPLFREEEYYSPCETFLLTESMIERLENAQEFYLEKVDYHSYDYKTAEKSIPLIGYYYYKKEWVEEIIDIPDPEITKELKNLMGAFK